jgi:hypothetical protein
MTGEIALQGDASRISLVAQEGEIAQVIPPGRFKVVSASHAASEPHLFTWIDVAGDGRLVAWLLSGAGEPDPAFPIRNPHNFLEGDEMMAIDGTVAVRGTGTEDIFNGGFYFRDGAYGWPWGGASRIAVRDNGWGEAQMARYYLGADQVRFRERITGTLEIGANHPNIAHDYRSLAILYVRP